MQLERLQLLVTGQVQGVGFRPHVYRTALKLALTGWVQNNASGVLIEIQGKFASNFMSDLKMNLPPLAKIDRILTKIMSPQENESNFQIRESESGQINTIISPDVSICSDCLQELFDSNSRYYLYPFLNCTHCGPRLTITRHLPYDRLQTSMDVFPLCESCCEDYTNPLNRRYHAQPTACIQCGPQLTSSFDEIAQCISQGEIIALKGLGGYQLICDAKNPDTVRKLRERKNREAKPFALMVLNLTSANSIVELNPVSKELLMSRERPIVILPKLDNQLTDELAPGLSHYGVMLPYTPLQYLLFHTLAGKPKGDLWLNEIHESILIVTSANPGGNPLVIDDQVAQDELENIADKIISYNRKIVCRTDDSVVRIINDSPSFIRRARGYVPTPIKLPHAIPSTLAVGGHLKNTFCLTRDDEAFVSQYIGSLNNKSTIEFFHELLDHFKQFLDVKPERIAHDLHPDFYTTRFAEAYGLPVFPVQHHHAHLASVAAEHGVYSPVLGLALDGYGYGHHGEAWGGELFLLENITFERLGCLKPLPQPGGDIAAREPWRMAVSVLHHLGKKDEINIRFKNQPHADAICDLLDKKINSPLSSSCGRLFDAVSALLGVQTVSNYEGHAAMLLESLVTSPDVLQNGWCVEDNNFDITPTLDFLSSMSDPTQGANLFHGTLIMGLGEWIRGIARERKIDTVLLSGGCFLNKILTEGLTKHLMQFGIKPLLPRNLPPNDGGISLGQAWIAGKL